MTNNYNDVDEECPAEVSEDEDEEGRFSLKTKFTSKCWTLDETVALEAAFNVLQQSSLDMQFVMTTFNANQYHNQFVYK